MRSTRIVSRLPTAAPKCLQEFALAACADRWPNRRAGRRWLDGSPSGGGTLAPWEAGSRTPAGTARRSASSSTPTACCQEITDDLLYHGDLNNALRRMMQSGFRDRNGERLQGLRELMEKLRAAPVGPARAAQPRRRLRRHRAGAARHHRPGAPGARRPRPAGARQRRPAPPGAGRVHAPAEHQMELDMLPPDLAGQVQELQELRVHLAGGVAALRGAARPAPPAAHAALRQPDGLGHGERDAGADAAHEGHAGRPQRDAGAARAGRGSRRSSSSWSASATSSPRTRRRSTSCSRSWPSGWRPCRPCSTR